MLRRAWSVWMVFVSVSAFSAAAAPDSSGPRVLDTGFHLKIEADWVSVNASVRDPRNHRNELGLGKEDFLVYEDQVLQNLGSCIPGQTPFSVLLLMDVSASTAPFIHVLRESALAFARQLGPSDRIALMTFSSRSRLLLPPTKDRGRMKAALRFVVPDSTTSFYDALMSAFQVFARTSGRKAIVVFSDGVDNQLLNPKEGSRATFTEVRDVARQSDCLIYSILLSPAPEAGVRHPSVREAEAQMQTLATETGGRMYTLRGAERLAAQYSEIAHELRFIYTLTYAPSRLAAPGWRTLRVEVKGRPELSVRARTGYLNKPQEPEEKGQKSE